MMHEPAWYVAQVITGSEQDIANKLNNAGMRAIVPVEVLHERRNGQWWPIRRTAFPGYVFIYAAMSERVYYYIKQFPRVIRLLGSQGPEAVPDEQMQIVEYLANDGMDFGMSEGEKEDGKTVIKSGPLTRLAGQIVKVNARARRATVEVPILGDVYQVDVGIILTQTETQEEQTETQAETEETQAT